MFDNGSTSDTLQYLDVLTSEQPAVRAVHSGTNIGFAAAVNAAIAATSAPSVVILNDDVILAARVARCRSYARAPRRRHRGGWTVHEPYRHRVGNTRALSHVRRNGRGSRMNADGVSPGNAPSSTCCRCSASRFGVGSSIESARLDERYGLQSVRRRRLLPAAFTRPVFALTGADNVFVPPLRRRLLRPPGSERGSTPTSSSAIAVASSRSGVSRGHRIGTRPILSMKACVYHAVRQLVAERLPADAPVGVVSRGDDGLVEHGHRPAWHVPHDTSGRWAGCYPADEQEALVELHDLMADGTRFLVVPAPSRWWSDRYPALDKLDTVVDEDACRIVALDGIVSWTRGTDARPWRKWWRLLRRIPPYVSPYRKLATASFGAMLLGVLFSLAAPWPLALLVDSALGDKPPPPAIEAVFGTNPMVLVVVAAVAGLLITLLTNILERVGRVREHEPVPADDPRLPIRALRARAAAVAGVPRRKPHGRIHRASES